MLGVAVMSTFACKDCGSVSIILPAELIDSARVTCSGCGRDHGCWSQFKLDAEQIISAEPHGSVNGSGDRSPADDWSRRVRAPVRH